MYGSLFVLLSAFEIIGASANPFLEKKSTPPNVRPLVEPELVDLTGYYTCKGEEAGGKKYTGIVTLIKKNDVYLISWVVGTGSNFNGIAIRQGNQLAASWSITTERGLVRGVNLYRIESTSSGPRLIGRWSSVPGPGVQQNEMLAFLKKLDKDDD
ncbi:MAG: hypothetical protein FJ303_12895 [Planctomycetes bacterium]|nr:hypothetical protein [Planctomycetota bacterium]